MDAMDKPDISLSSPMDGDTLIFAADLFAALAHPTRLRMVEFLTGGEQTVGDIAQHLRILQPNASQHLAILQRAGVIKVTPRGAQRHYSLRGPRIARILMLVNEFRAVHAHKLMEERLIANTPEATRKL